MLRRHRKKGAGMNRLDDKIALITGGARGMGATEAELFIDTKTRLSRFALDPDMSVDVLVFADGECVAFLSTKVRYVK